LIVSDVPVFRPQADVAVVDREAEPDANYADRFYLAAEIISKTNTAADISTKRLRYQLHPENQYCLIIDPKVVRIQVFARATGWTPVTLTSLADTLELPVLGFSCQVRTIYSGTPLAPL
jgi:Uma2 family endonuclease